MKTNSILENILKDAGPSKKILYSLISDNYSNLGMIKRLYIL